MERQFDRIIKPIEFTDKKKCVQETEKDINKSNESKIDEEHRKNPIVRIQTKENLHKFIFPRIEHFHNNYSKNKYPISSTNTFKETRSILLHNRKLPIYISTPSKKATYDTLEYVFDHFHSIVFVQILNNKIYTFVLIDNYNSYMDMLPYLKVDPKKYKNIDEFMEVIQKEQYKNKQLVRKQEDSIYFTDCSIHLWDVLPEPSVKNRLWLYIQQYHLLNELLSERKINDTEFFMNYKDRVVLEENGKYNPHYHIVGNLNTPLPKKIKKYIPILNFTGRTNFADIPMPSNDDWEICSNKIFLGTCRDSYLDINKKINTNYESKIPTAIFRGGATGCGTIIKNNPRLKAAYLSKKYHNHPKYGTHNKIDGNIYLDARLVSFKKKIKKHYSDEYIQFINPKQLQLKLSKPIPLSDIANYKYILSIEGNVAAYRLSLELSYNSVILLVKSNFYTWYQPLLKPWVHYIPIESDLSDLMDKIHWCKMNDHSCQQIAHNATIFFKEYINKKSVYDYMELILNS